MRALPLLLPFLVLSAGLLVQAAPGISDDPALLRFGAPILIDDVRAGGEPVIAATPDAILVSAHPGFTHLYIRAPSAADPTRAHLPTEVVQDYAGESYLWRSTDGGATWQNIGLPLVNVGPRAASPGISDPDMTVLGNGRVVHSDLYAAGSGISFSDDQGETWLGNPDVSFLPVDRNWVASSDDTLWFTANYLVTRFVGRSDDGGLTWNLIQGAPAHQCGGDFIAGRDDTLYISCGSRLEVSSDGAHFSRSGPAGHSGSSINEPALDGAGNVWITWPEGQNRVYLAGTPDKGATWPWVYDLTPQVRSALGDPTGMAVVWPWVSAGSAGRVSVTLYASPVSGSPTSGAPDRPWSVVNVATFGADTAAPASAGQVVKANHHLGPICLSGTTCMVGSVQGQAGSDRRMGDFFETTIGLDGSLLIAFSDTTAHPDDVISHPGFVRQIGGPKFVVDGFRPLQG